MIPEARIERAYRLHAKSAAQRGIGFDLSFDQWFAIWGDMGQFAD